METPKKVTIQAIVDDELHDKIKQDAERESRKVSQHVSHVLKVHISEVEKQNLLYLKNNTENKHLKNKNMENTLNFNVKENSIQEFAKNYIVHLENPRDFGRRESEVINPYYILGKDKFYVKRSIKDLIPGINGIVFTLSDESRNNGTKLTNTYVYHIDAYDDILFELILIDFKVEVAK